MTKVHTPESAAEVGEIFSAASGLPRSVPLDAALRPGLLPDWAFARRVLLTIGIVALAYFLWRISDILLLIFAAILIAIPLRANAKFIAEHTPLSQRWALAVVTLAIATFLIVLSLLFGAQIIDQIAVLSSRLPSALEAIGIRVGLTDAAKHIESIVEAGYGGSIVAQVAGVGYTAFGAVTDALLVVVTAIFFAAEPLVYIRGATKMLPPPFREEFQDTITLTGKALRLWFRGQVLSMLLVGVISACAFWMLGLPSPIALGLFMAITDFIPIIGPILGALPATIFAFSIGLDAVLWTIVAVIVIQQIEGNLIVPFIQKRVVSLPPAVALFAIVVFGLLFGFLGVFLAIPLAVTITVFLKKLWIRETLGEETHVPGER